MKMDIQEMEWEGLDWIELAPDRDKCGGCCVDRNEHSGSTKYGEFLD
jgi:hypothetical protein